VTKKQTASDRWFQSQILVSSEKLKWRLADSPTRI